MPDDGASFQATHAGQYWGRFTVSQFHFGDFTLDQSRYVLQRGERALRLEKIPMELLILLVERSGELVTREEIAKRLWGEHVYVDVDHSINVAVRKIRVVLRDDSEKPRFVETVVGKGYRFAAPVTCAEEDGRQSGKVRVEEELKPALAAAVDVPSQPTSIVPKRRGWLIVSSASLVLALMTLAYFAVRSRGAAAGEPKVRSLAVLPLQNLSGDSSQDYVADGMTEELIGRLSRIHGLRVISRTSSMHFKNTQLSVPEIAKMLAVDAIVEGSLVQEGRQIRVHAQLIRAATDEHIWAGEYQREFGSILEVQEAITRSIAEHIELNLTPEERGRLASTAPVDPEAYENYLKGRYYFNQRTEEALHKSIV